MLCRGLLGPEKICCQGNATCLPPPALEPAQENSLPRWGPRALRSLPSWRRRHADPQSTQWSPQVCPGPGLRTERAPQPWSAPHHSSELFGPQKSVTHHLGAHYVRERITELTQDRLAHVDPLCSPASPESYLGYVVRCYGEEIDLVRQPL